MATHKKSSLAAFGKVGKPHFENVIDGIYGTFETPAGRVAYLQTKATVGGSETPHGKLIKSMVPAREALATDEMDFNQLLQRDLDDHRIATKLIEYILHPPVNSLPGFYPPILALLLPFDDRGMPVENFPIPKDSAEDDHEYPEMRFRCTTYPSAFRIQYAVDGNDAPLPIPFGVLRWNPTTAKMVIMDGQHRAMSLLAIQRTLTKTWDTCPKGSRYRPFYEHHVEAWIRQSRGQVSKKIDLTKIELPVTICWFPEQPKSKAKLLPHLAARKLFVDVNNNAKPPSESRLILLSDTELQNIFARELLNRLRRDRKWGAAFPLCGIEYDNPDKNSTSPRRWSVVTSLDIIKESVIRTVFGPERVLDRPMDPFPGQPSPLKMDERMRSVLQVDTLFPTEFEDGDRRMHRDDLGNRTFPINDTARNQKLLDRFYETWGDGVLTLLSTVEPYRAHLQALMDRDAAWNPSDNVSILAKDAVFEGVGMLWTIESGHLHWAQQKKDAQAENLTPPEQPDISKAWEIIDKEQKSAFLRRRCEIYLGSDAREDLGDCEQLYSVLITYAAQVGLMLAWGSLHLRCAPNSKPSKLAEALAQAINQGITAKQGNRDRRRLLMRTSRAKGFVRLNGLTRLEPALASQFRYLWLVLALSEEGRPILAKAGVDMVCADELLRQCHSSYLGVLVKELQRVKAKDKALRDLSPQEQKAEARKLAIEEVVEDQAQAHKYWFGVLIAEAREQVRQVLLGSDEETLADPSLANGNGTPSESDEPISEDNDDDGKI